MRNNRVIISLSFVASALVLTVPLWPSNEHRCPVSPTHRSGDAQAAPEYARTYNMDCSCCHTTVSGLTRGGYIFKRMGYRMPYEVDSADDAGWSTRKSKVGPRSGEQVYMDSCQPCHSTAGNNVVAFKPIKGANFVHKYGNDAALANTIRTGIPETGMPAYPPKWISDTEMTRLIAYLRKMTPGGSEPTAPSHPGPLTGQEVFDRSCSGCHKNGGNSFNSKILKGPGFTSKYPDDTSLINLIRNGVKGTPMPAYNTTSLSNEDMKSLIPYIRSLK